MVKNKNREDSRGIQERMAHVGRLSAGIGHNIMTPLSLIMMNADLMTMKLKDNKELQKHLEEIVNQASQISKIVETMMWKVKAEEQSEPSMIQFGDLVREDLNFWMGDMFFKHKLEREFRINPHTPPIYGIPFHFTAFLDEWITHVIERARPVNGGRLVVEADARGENEIYIQFEDFLPLPSEEHLKVLESWCTLPQSEEFYPALTRLLRHHPADLDFEVLAEDGLRLRLSWTI